MIGGRVVVKVMARTSPRGRAAVRPLVGFVCAVSLVAGCASTRGGGDAGTVTVTSTVTQPGTTTASSAPADTPSKPAGSGRYSGTFSARPLVAPTVTAASGAARPSPLTQLPFPVPTVDTEYDRLDHSRQETLEQSLAATDCASPPVDPAGRWAVVCDDGSAGPRTVALVGPAVFTGAGVQRAAAEAPTTQTAPTWTVAITLDTAADAAWSSYTAAHNIGGTGSSVTPASACGRASTPCADFVALSVGSALVSLPVTTSTISGIPTVISGTFSQAQAEALARAVHP
ncbi:MAG: SecDF P1 head subdomain-containing protein [Jatrophihabitans sp.]|uniref:SecDF P1 head subdomain-containing protein n=1 Tax=Jatrophihabitans sp. TaxID=1932789 RepID=UPI003F81B740